MPDSNAQELIQQIAGTYGKSPVQVMICTVQSVDAAARTCTVVPVTDNLSSFPAQLMSDIADGLLIIPKVSSTVRVLLSEIIAPTVIQFSDVDSIFMVGGTGSVKIYSTSVDLNGADFGGVPKVQGVTDKIVRLENKLNALIAKWDAFCGAYLPGSPSTTGLPATLAGSTIGNLTPITKKSDLENTKVKHGAGS